MPVRGKNEFDFLTALNLANLTMTPMEFGAFPFVNIPECRTFKPHGGDGNHNIVSLSNGTVIGFAPQFFTEPRTSHELEDLLHQAFVNDDNLDSDAARSSHKKFCASLSREQFNAKREAYQKQIGTFAFDFQKILDYRRISTTKACAECGKLKSESMKCSSQLLQ